MHFTVVMPPPTICRQPTLGQILWIDMWGALCGGHAPGHHLQTADIGHSLWLDLCLSSLHLPFATALCTSGWGVPRGSHAPSHHLHQPTCFCQKTRGWSTELQRKGTNVKSQMLADLCTVPVLETKGRLVTCIDTSLHWD